MSLWHVSDAFLLEVYAIRTRVSCLKFCPCQAQSLSSIQRIAEAARQDGADHAELQDLAKLGAHGRWPQNIERDLHRAHRRNGTGLQVRPYNVEINKRDGTRVNVSMILPHEVFGSFMSKFPKKAMAWIGGSHHRVLEYWQCARAEDWFRNFPNKFRVESEPEKVLPLRIWADDVASGKSGRCMRAACWSGAVANAPSMRRHFLIFGLDPKVFSLESQDTLWQVVAWSLTQMAIGYYPSLDHQGRCWNEDHDPGRLKLAAQPLASNGYTAVYTQTGADWKYLIELFKLPWTWETIEVCRFCRASRRGVLNYADTREDAQWTQTSRTDEDYLLAVGEPPGRCQTLGWTLSTIVDDLQHDDLLGVRLNLCGSALKMFADACVWRPDDHARGWIEKMDRQLKQGYVRFQQYCKANSLEHSTTEFTHLSLSLRKKNDWAVLKSKAHNCAVISQWLCHEAMMNAHLGERWDVLATTLRGFVEIFRMCCLPVVRFSDAEVAAFATARKQAMEGFHWLSLDASKIPAYLFKVTPKLHKMDHSLRRSIATRLNPGTHWAFSSEDWIGYMSHLGNSCHSRTMHQRAAERWLVSFDEVVLNHVP